jgi:hypothetical protein
MIGKMWREVLPGGNLLQQRSELRPCRLKLQRRYSTRPKLYRSRLGQYEPRSPRDKR